MIKPQRIKRYKNCEPKETIEYIKSILDKAGIKTDTRFHHENTSNVDSCRINIVNDDLVNFQIGTNGKGMNKEYSLASAYGEFMERLQNDLLLEGVFLNPNSYEIVDNKKAEPYIKQYIKEIYGENEKVSSFFINKDNNVRLEKFYDVFENKTIFLPRELMITLCGSTGMAAGNTYNEAILQGLSEIFERYVMRELISNKITLPEIPVSYFEDTSVLKKLNSLKKHDFSYRILDASLAKGYPVIGLVLNHDNKIIAKFGADPCPITALERCLSEIMQGRDSLDSIPLYSTNDIEEEIKNYAHSEKDFWQHQYLSSARVTRGVYPKETFDSELEPSYIFEGFKHPISTSDEDDLKHYFNILKQNNRKLYISKKGFMGFPACFVMVPGMNEHILVDDDGQNFLDYYKAIEEVDSINRIPLLNKSEMIKLADNIINWFDKYYHSSIDANKLFKNVCNYYYINRIVGFLYACGGDKEKANVYIDKYLKSDKGLFLSDEKLKEMVERGDVNECFPRSYWPTCPNCNLCQVKESCNKKAKEELRDHIIKTFIN